VERKEAVISSKPLSLELITMANPEHLKILNQGVKEWNHWRDKNTAITPDLSEASLDSRELCDYLPETFFNFERLAFKVRGINFSESNLSNIYLSGAKLLGADLTRSNLSSANFQRAILDSADLTYSDLTNSDFSAAFLIDTRFGNNDLCNVKGLETVSHKGPSVIGIDTLYRSGGKIPEKFLRGCGVPDEFITYMHSLTAHPIQFYSCFISYSSKDQDFANRLYVDLQNKGVRCWFAPEDLKIGDKIRDRIDESIRLRDKLLLILSEHSIASEWVEQEVESALEEERQRGRTILFPVRIDDAVMESQKAWASLIRRTRHIGDFTHWKEHDQYSKAFDRLLRDLKTSE
jgi:uncharacterized protein YjbI with pentapeptide repeats